MAENENHSQVSILVIDRCRLGSQDSSFRIASVVMSTLLEKLAAPVNGLDAVLLTVSSDDLLYQEWTRYPDIVMSEDVAGYLGHLSKIRRDMLRAMQIHSPLHRASLETHSHHIIFTHVEEQYLIVCVFQKKIPIGIAHIQVNTFVDALRTDLPLFHFEPRGSSSSARSAMTGHDDETTTETSSRITPREHGAADRVVTSPVFSLRVSESETTTAFASSPPTGETSLTLPPVEPPAPSGTVSPSTVAIDDSASPSAPLSTSTSMEAATIIIEETGDEPPSTAVVSYLSPDQQRNPTTIEIDVRHEDDMDDDDLSLVPVGSIPEPDNHITYFTPHDDNHIEDIVATTPTEPSLNVTDTRNVETFLQFVQEHAENPDTILTALAVHSSVPLSRLQTRTPVTVAEFERLKATATRILKIEDMPF